MKRFCLIFGAVLRGFFVQVAVIRLKPSGLRCVDISGNFNAVLFCYFVRCLYTGISVRFCGVRTLLTPPVFLDFCLI